MQLRRNSFDFSGPQRKRLGHEESILECLLLLDKRRNLTCGCLCRTSSLSSTSTGPNERVFYGAPSEGFCFLFDDNCPPFNCLVCPGQSVSRTDDKCEAFRVTHLTSFSSKIVIFVASDTTNVGQKRFPSFVNFFLCDVGSI